MSKYEYKVNIEAESPEEARRVLQAMFDLMKTVRGELSTEDFIRFSAKIKSKPALIQKAKFFLM